MSAVLTTRYGCELCSGPVSTVLSLPPTPPANAFQRTREAARGLTHYPLDLDLCSACGHLQLRDSLAPSELFSDYVYASGTSDTFVHHFHGYSEWAVDAFDLQPNDLVVEIGSNDGTLLKMFKSKGMRVLGVEPGKPVADIAVANGIPTVRDFFTRDLAMALRREYGLAKLIVANNVLAHVPDLHDIVEGVRWMLQWDGALVFEVQYLRDLIEQRLFDMVYHEHLSYHTVAPLMTFFDRHEMSLTDVSRVGTHGGSIRCTARPDVVVSTIPDSVAALVAYERINLGLHQRATYTRLREELEKWRESFLDTLRDAPPRPQNGHHLSTPRRLIGYGAPAKTTTLLAYLHERSCIMPSYIVDDSPLKHGLFTPGTGIEIRPPSALEQENPNDVLLLILAWNFAGPIMEKLSDFRAKGGRFLVPLPEPKVI